MASVNAATPLVLGDQIFVSATYETGAALLRVKDDALTEVWSSDEAMSNHYATSVVLQRRLCTGYHGRQEFNPSFRAVELATGKVRWSEDQFRAGTVTLAGDKLLILRETGELVIAEASPQAFRPIARAQILPPTLRAHPALADGFPLRAQQRHQQPRRSGLLRPPSVTDGTPDAKNRHLQPHLSRAATTSELMKVAPDFKDIGKRMRDIPMLADLDVRFRVMDRFGEYQQVLSLADAADRGVCESAPTRIDLAQRGQRRHGGAGAQASRSVYRLRRRAAAERSRRGGARDRSARSDELGARGIPDLLEHPRQADRRAPEFLPLFEAMAGYDLPIWLHPYRGADIAGLPDGGRDPSTRSGGRSAGRTTRAWRWRGSCSPGYFDRFPNLKIITHHMGAMAPYFEGRVGPGWDQLGARTSDRRLLAGR